MTESKLFVLAIITLQMIIIICYLKPYNCKQKKKKKKKNRKEKRRKKKTSA